MVSNSSEIPLLDNKHPVVRNRNQLVKSMQNKRSQNNTNIMIDQIHSSLENDNVFLSLKHEDIKSKISGIRTKCTSPTNFQTISNHSRPFSTKSRHYPPENMVKRRQMNCKVKSIAIPNIKERRAEIHHHMKQSRIGQA